MYLREVLLTCGCGGAPAPPVPSPAGAVGTLAASAYKVVASLSTCTFSYMQSKSKLCAQ